MESPVMSTSPQLRLCKVCEDRSDGAHFGVESCRACAAFFRRSVVMRKKYICRQGQENCHINKTVRCMCRCCRFAKCQKVGMLRDAVQSPRDQIGKRSEQNEMKFIKMESADSTSDPFFYNPTIETLADVFDTEERLMPILKRIQDGYTELRQRRSHYKHMFPVYDAATDGTFPDPNIPRRITHMHGFKLLGHDHENIVHFMRNSFPRLEEFDSDQRKVLYRSCFASFIMVDSAYNTYLQGGDHTERWYVSDGNFIDIADVSHYYYMPGQGSSLTPEEASRLFRPTFAMFLRNVLQPMRILRLTDIEFFALVALCFYSHGVDGGTTDTDQKAMEVREAIIRELTYYYTRFACIKDYPLRLAHLTLMLPSIHRITTRFREDVEINKLFNTEYADEKVYNLINGNLA